MLPLKKQKGIDTMENRIKTILHRRDCTEDDYKLALTQEQIDLLIWLIDERLISSDDYDVQVLEDTDHWVEV